MTVLKLFLYRKVICNNDNNITNHLPFNKKKSNIQILKLFGKISNE